MIVLASLAAYLLGLISAQFSVNLPVRWGLVTSPPINKPSLSYYILAGTSSSLLTILVLEHFGFNNTAYWGLLLAQGLLLLALIDFTYQLLPDRLTFVLLWLGLLSNSLHSTFSSIENAVLGVLIGYLSLASLAWIFQRITGKVGMAPGDFKLLAALGAWLGWQALIWILLFASFAGSFVGGALIISKQREATCPQAFGPYLASAGIIVLIWGKSFCYKWG